MKINKSLILNLENGTQNQVLVQTAIQMAHNLDMKVVAEGVESERSRAILEKMGCDICQGYHFSRPVPAQNFNKLLSNRALNIAHISKQLNFSEPRAFTRAYKQWSGVTPKEYRQAKLLRNKL